METLRDKDHLLARRLPIGEYTRRTGTSGISGQLYEIHLLVDLLLKSTEYHRENQTFHFDMATNMEQFGDFDDIILFYHLGDNPVFGNIVQAKHRDNADKSKITLKTLLGDSSKGDFSLSKYFRTYLNIKNHNIAEKFECDMKNINFIIFTNSAIELKGDDYTNVVKETMSDAIIEIGNGEYHKIVLTGSRGDEIKQHLMNSSKMRRLIMEIKEAVEKGYKINVDSGLMKEFHYALAAKVIRVESQGKGKLMEEILSDNEDMFIKMLREELRCTEKQISDVEIQLPKNFGSVKDRNATASLPCDAVTQEDIDRFLTSFKLFTSQSNVGELKDIIKQKLRDFFQIPEIDVTKVFSHVCKEMEGWWQIGKEFIKEDDRFLEKLINWEVMFDLRFPNELFTGRSKELEMLHTSLLNSEKNFAVVSQIVSISGLGGIGKTELARKYVQDHREYYQNNVVWINAESDDTAQFSFKCLAAELGISMVNKEGEQRDLKHIMQNIYNYLPKSKVLLVFDNAEHAEYLYNYLPSNYRLNPLTQVYVLMTSRDSAWEDGISIVTLGPLQSFEVIELLKKRFDESDAQMELLAERLQYFPLALQQAIAYIGQQKTTREYSIEDYLKCYDEKQQIFLNSKLSLIKNDYIKTTYTTWNISMDKIKDSNKLSFEILQKSAYLCPQDIHIEMFLNLDSVSQDEIYSSVLLLIKYSMMNYVKESKMLSVHRLVQDVIRIHVRAQLEEENILTSILFMLENNITNVTVSHVGQLWKYTLCYDSLVLEHATLAAKTLKCLNSMFRCREADSLGNQILQKLTNINAPFSFGTFEIKYVFIANALALDKNDVAYGVCNDLLSNICGTSIIGDISSELVSEQIYAAMPVLLMLSKIHRTKGNYTDSLQVLNVVKNFQLTLENQWDMCDTEGYLSLLIGISQETVSVYCSAGKYDEALSVCENILESEWVKDNISMVETLSNMPSVDEEEGILNRPPTLYEKILQTESDEVEVFKSFIVCSMGLVYIDKGDYDKALTLYKKSLSILCRLHGGYNIHSVKTLDYMGSLYVKKGNFDEALSVYEKTLEVQMKEYGEHNISTAKTLNDMGTVHYEKGDYKKALLLLEQCLKVQLEELGEHTITSANTLSNIGSVYREKGNYDKALSLYEEALSVELKEYGGYNISIVGTLNNIGSLHLLKSNYDEAVALHGKALEIQLNEYCGHNLNTATTLNLIGLVHKKKCDYKEALSSFGNCLVIQLKEYGKYNINTAKTLNNMGLVYCENGDYNKALSIYERNLGIQMEEYGGHNIYTAITLNNMGFVHKKLGNYDKAIELYEESLAIELKEYGGYNITTSTTLCNIASVCDEKGSHDKALALYKTALEIQVKEYNGHNASTADLLNHIESMTKRNNNKIGICSFI